MAQNINNRTRYTRQTIVTNKLSEIPLNSDNIKDFTSIARTHNTIVNFRGRGFYLSVFHRGAY
jgi:hypothetical protein